MIPHFLFFSCEHATNFIPPLYQHLFREESEVLDTHRGYDIGALELVSFLAEKCFAPLHTAKVSRLLVDLNRSTHHPKIFSTWSKTLVSEEKKALLRTYYDSYRHPILANIRNAIKNHYPVIHLSIHSFTPVFNHEFRRADIGFLYDPTRPLEKEFCAFWGSALKQHIPTLTIRKNYPYRGTSDGFTTALRKQFSESLYLGIEIEVNQKFPLQDLVMWNTLKQNLFQTLQQTREHFQSQKRFKIPPSKSKTERRPPSLKQIPHTLHVHGHTRVDPYYWFRERDNPEVSDYLEKENRYTNAIMGHTKSLQKKLFQEINGRVEQDESSLPYWIKPYYYYHHYLEKRQYPIYCRKKDSLEANKEILLDLNVVAENHLFCQLGGYTVTPDHQWLAYAVDFQGRRLYTIFFKNLKTGQLFEKKIEHTSRELVWANDSLTLFFSKKDLQTLRPFQVWRYTLGDAQEKLVYEEKETSFRVYVNKSQSQKYLYLISMSTLSTEYRYLDADKPQDSFQLFQPRELKHEYFLDHQGNRFFIRTNKNAPNFKIMETPLSKTQEKHWKEVIPHAEHIFLKDMELFQDYLAIQTAQNGLSQIAILPLKTRKLHYLKFEEPAYTASLSYNPDFHSAYLRFRYQSLTVPDTIYDYHMETGEKILRKQQQIRGSFRSEHYCSERRFATASDGTQIPISLVYKKGLTRNAKNPLLLEGYGSYGANMDPDFSSSRLSLLDRGFIYAIAHIRGSSTMGRTWYENGKLLQKKNTFNDFIACSEFLIQEQYTSPKHLYALGTSAGGMLMGVVANTRPDLYHGLIVTVPFVDIVTTMLDPSMPLTTVEYDEWGNPENKEYYDYMLSYSPYDNVKAQIYPHLLVTTGFYDSQVQYWEPAKWVAKLRTLKLGNQRLLLKTNMHAGHSGASGRYEKMQEIAFGFAFILDLEGIKN